ncbi:MAG: DUF488 family protein [Halobacteriales archaeon]|nr:DUF488 family protein [Halobacteriales archaeon]
MIRTKHLRADPVEAADGTRILVTRYYPRGIAKDAGLWQAWEPDLGPSRELHGDVKDGRIGWDAYERRYLAEMRGEEALRLLDALAARAARGETLTLLCDHPRSMPAERCHRFLLQRLLTERAAGPRATF